MLPEPEVDVQKSRPPQEAVENSFFPEAEKEKTPEKVETPKPLVEKPEPVVEELKVEEEIE